MPLVVIYCTDTASNSSPFPPEEEEKEQMSSFMTTDFTRRPYGTVDGSVDLVESVDPFSILRSPTTVIRQTVSSSGSSSVT